MEQKENFRKIANLIDEIDKVYNTKRCTQIIANALLACDFEVLEYISKDWLLTEKKPPTIADFMERYRLVNGWRKVTLEE